MRFILPLAFVLLTACVASPTIQQPINAGANVSSNPFGYPSDADHPPVAFDRTGDLTDGNPDGPGEVWHLLYGQKDEDGFRNIAYLSEDLGPYSCMKDGQDVVCIDVLRDGLRVRVQGETRGDPEVVSVKLITISEEQSPTLMPGQR